MRRVQENTALEAVLPGPASLGVPVPWGQDGALLVTHRDCRTWTRARRIAVRCDLP